MEKSIEDVCIQVAARIRPCPDLSEDQHCVQLDKDNQSIWLQDGINVKKEYEFDCVLDASATQDEVFEKVAKDTLNACLDGYNGTILVFGQTTSGKTFTMQGADPTDSNYSQLKGIMPRAVECLFKGLETKKSEKNDQFNFQVSCSFLEIYNEQLFDLVNPEKTPRLRRHNDKMILENASITKCHQTKDVLEIISTGVSNRQVAETLANRKSSRSHSILIINVVMEETQGSDEMVVKKTARLNLVDLAGAERLITTKSKEQQKETICINKSLTNLGRVIRSLSKKERYIPYRDSILTYLLADSLGGNSRTTFIVTLHPDNKQFNTTASSLQFSRALKLIRNKVRVNQESFVVNKTLSPNLTASSLSHLILNDCSENSFERMEEIANNLAAIEQQKKQFAENYNQLSLKEAQLIQQLEAYKTHESFVVHDTFSDVGFSPARNSASRTLSSVRKANLCRSKRRQTIFGLSTSTPLTIHMPLPNNNQLDFEKENVDALNSTHTVINSVETLKKLSQPDAHESQISMPDETLNSTGRLVIIEDSEFLSNFHPNKSNSSEPSQMAELSLHGLISDAELYENNKSDQSTSEGDSNVFVVERILDKRVRKGVIQYLIKWLDYPEDESTWESEANCANCKYLIDEFEKSQPKKKNLKAIPTSKDKIVMSSDGEKPVPNARYLLRTNRKTKKFITMQSKDRVNRPPLSMQERELIVNAVNEYKSDIYGSGVSNARRYEVWQAISEKYNEQFGKTIGVNSTRRMWNRCRSRALRMANNGDEAHKMTSVDHIALDIINEHRR